VAKPQGKKSLGNADSMFRRVARTRIKAAAQETEEGRPPANRRGPVASAGRPRSGGPRRRSGPAPPAAPPRR